VFQKEQQGARHFTAAPSRAARQHSSEGRLGLRLAAGPGPEAGVTHAVPGSGSGHRNALCTSSMCSINNGTPRLGWLQLCTNPKTEVVAGGRPWRAARPQRTASATAPRPWGPAGPGGRGQRRAGRGAPARPAQPCGCRAQGRQYDHAEYGGARIRL
jgi:hypothetical protein